MSGLLHDVLNLGVIAEHRDQPVAEPRKPVVKPLAARTQAVAKPVRDVVACHHADEAVQPPTRQRVPARGAGLPSVRRATVWGENPYYVALADQTDYEHQWLVDPRTGQVVFWTSDTGIDGENPVEIDELDLIPIDPIPSDVWYRDMADFAEGLSDCAAGRRLARALQGPGAFRRFKNQLYEHLSELISPWQALRDVRAQRRAVDWLLDQGLIDQNTAQKFADDHPRAQTALISTGVTPDASSHRSASLRRDSSPGSPGHGPDRPTYSIAESGSESVASSPSGRASSGP